MALCSNSSDEILFRQPLATSSSSRVSPASPTSVCSSQDSLFFATESCRAKRRGSTRSVSSSMTDWSTATAPASNTTQAQEAKKRHKSRFMKFARVLLHLLERKDPNRFAEARAVIRETEEQKRLGQVDSFSESVKGPLKDLAGKSYWKQAGRYSKKISRPQPEEFEPLSMTEEPPTFSQDDLARLEECLSIHDKHQPTWVFPLTTKSCQTPAEELKLRKERFWMLIRVLMKYLEKTDPEVYYQSRRIIDSCIRQSKRERNVYFDLTGSIQTQVKELVGVGRWRRAEAYLAKILIRRMDEAAVEANSVCFNDYDLEITDDSMKSFGAHGRWDEGLPGQRAHYQDTSNARREARPVFKRVRGRDYRSRSPAQRSRLYVTTNMDPKRRRVHNLEKS